MRAARSQRRVRAARARNRVPDKERWPRETHGVEHGARWSLHCLKHINIYSLLPIVVRLMLKPVLV